MLKKLKKYLKKFYWLKFLNLCKEELKLKTFYSTDKKERKLYPKKI